MSKILVLCISLFSAESGQASYRKVPCFTNKVLEWYKHVSLIFVDDKIKATVQLITCTVLQNCLSLFTIHCNSHFTSNTKFHSPIDFLYEGCHLSKIQLGTNVTVRHPILGTNVTEMDHKVLTSIYPAMNSSSSVTTGINNCQPLVYTFIPSFIPNWYY